MDESGSVSDKAQRFFVLAGVAVFEREPHWIDRDLNEIAARFSPQEPEIVELHGSPMRTGKGMWRSFPVAEREKAIEDALIIGVRQRFPRQARLFAAIFEKNSVAGQDIVQLAFEQLVSRFDQFLGRLHKKGDTQRGLIVFDKCSTEQHLQMLAGKFKTSGHSFGVLRNIAEVPMFVDSRASRLIQLADFVAYAIQRNYEYNDTKLFDLISHCFDTDGGVMHGFYCRLEGFNDAERSEDSSRPARRQVR